MWLSKTDPESVRKRVRIYTVAYFAFAFVDVAEAVLLYSSLHGWKLTNGPGLLQGLRHFETDAVDVVLLALARLILLPALALAAAKTGKPVESSAPAPPTGGPADPLLPTSGGAGLSQEDVHKLDSRAKFRRDCVLAGIFSCCTLFCMFTAVKCISFQFGPHGSLVRNGILMGGTVVWINLQNLALARAVEAVTTRAGILRPQVHPHELHYDKIPGHWCDLCRKPMREGYRCRVCDFDCCLPCWGRSDRSLGEGGLRGDKGLRVDTDVTPMQYLRRALRLAAPEAPLFSVAFLCLTLNSAASLYTPKLQGGILDRVVNADRNGFAEDVRLLIFFSLGTGVFGAIRGLCFQVVGRRIANNVRNQLFKRLLVQDIAYFDSANTGDLTGRLSYDTGSMVAPCQTLLSGTLQNVFSLVGGIVMCFITSWRLSLLAFTTLLPVAYVTERYARWSGRLNREIYTALGQANSVATEALGNIRTVKAFSTEDQEDAKYEERTGDALAKGVRDAVGGAGAFGLNQGLDLGAGVLILWYGGMLVLAGTGELSVGRLITFQLYWGTFNSAYAGLQNVLASFTRAAGAAQRVLSLIDSTPDIPHSEGRSVDWKLGCQVEMRGVHFFYQMRPDNPVLKGVDLMVPSGSVCALVGKSGGGKSTLVHLLLRFYDPTGGAIYFDDHALESLNLRDVHRQTGLVAQDTQMFADTVEYNMTYGLEPGTFTHDDVESAAIAAHAHEFITSFPDGYNTRVGERGVRLSGGQKQRLAIARAFLRRPQLLLLDEATSALDAESEALVQDSLNKLISEGGRTVVLVAHRLSTVVGADKIAVVDSGQVVEQGTHQELLSVKDGMYARLVGRQLARQANILDEAGATAGRSSSTSLSASPPTAAAAAAAASPALPLSESTDLIDKLIDSAPEAGAPEAGASEGGGGGGGGGRGGAGGSGPRARGGGGGKGKGKR